MFSRSAKRNVAAGYRRIYSKMAKSANPYGDRHASERITKILLEVLGEK